MQNILQDVINEREKVLEATIQKVDENQNQKHTLTNQNVLSIQTVIEQHEQQFKKEDEIRAPLTEAEMKALGITNRFGIYYDKDGKPISMTKMEIMQSLVEANMTRGVMVDKIENCCQSILM